jgi:hypothetical protein
MHETVNLAPSGYAGSNPARRTIEEIASQRKPPRFARRPVCIEFSGQKRIGDFEKRKGKFLIIVV